MESYNKLCFSILFEDRKSIINKLSSLFFEKNKLMNIKLVTLKTNLIDWVDPIYGQLSNFYVGASNESSKTFFLTNLPDGWTTMSRYLSKIVSCKCIQIRISTEPKSGLFEYCLINSGETIRTIQLLQDTKWIFSTEGDPLPYEDLTHYENKHTSKRFNVDLIKSYLNSEGIDFDQLFLVDYTGVKYETLSWDYLE